MEYDHFQPDPDVILVEETAADHSPSQNDHRKASMNSNTRPTASVRIDRDRCIEGTGSIKLPAWVSSVEPYFKFLQYGIAEKRGRRSLELACNLCVELNAKKNVFKGTDVGNFAKHLKVNNHDCYAI